MAVKRRAPRSSVSKRPKVWKKPRDKKKPGKPAQGEKPGKPAQMAKPRSRLRKPEIREPMESPWGEGELGGIIERACRFIEGAKERCGRELGWEVGKYLYWEVYGGDDAYIRLNDPGKEDSLRDIAGGSGVPYTTLYDWLMAAYVRIKLEQAGFSPELSIKHLRFISSVGDDVQVMLEIARWAQERGIRARDMPGIVDRWQEHLEKGGRLGDLVRFPAPVKKRRRRKGRARSRDLVVPRILELVLAWVKRAELGKAYREKVRHMVLGVRARVTGVRR